MNTVHQVLTTKLGMTQAWTTDGKRLAVTRLRAADLMVVGGRAYDNYAVVELGVGQKKLKNVHKSLRSRLEKSGFSVSPKQIVGTRVAREEKAPAVGSMLSVVDQLAIGDVVAVQGTTKGRGFAGVVKRHGFAGGPKTHGQSDRHRAPGAIGNRTTPGRVFKNKRMPGHYGVETVTIPGLVVLYVDNQAKEVWVSGPVPGSYGSVVQLKKTGQTKKIKLDSFASGLPEEQKVEEKLEEKTDEPVEKKIEIAVEQAGTVASKEVATEATDSVEKTEEKVDEILEPEEMEKTGKPKTEKVEKKKEEKKSEGSK